MAEREAQKKGLSAVKKSHPGEAAPQLYALERAQGLNAQIKRGDKLTEEIILEWAIHIHKTKFLQVHMDRMRCRLLPPPPSYPPFLQRIYHLCILPETVLYLPETVAVHVHAGRDVPINLFTQTVAWYMLYYNFFKYLKVIRIQ